MQVQITMTGLCLFVPDPDGLSVHVLLPNTSGTFPSGPIHEHRPKVSFTGMAHTLPGIHTYSVDLRPLRPAGGGSLPAGWTNHLLDVEDIAGAKVPSNRWGEQPEHSITASVRLPLPDSVRAGRKKVRWKVPQRPSGEKPASLVHQLTWIFEGIPDVMLERRLLRSTSQVVQAVGAPLPGTDDVIRIDVTNLPLNNYPLCQYEFALHAQAYYAVVPSRETRTPQLDEPSPKPGCPGLVPLAPFDRSASAYNCMLGYSGGKI